MKKESFDKIKSILNSGIYWEREKIRYISMKHAQVVVESFTDEPEAKKINSIISSSITETFTSQNSSYKPNLGGSLSDVFKDIFENSPNNLQKNTVIGVSIQATLSIIEVFVMKESESFSGEGTNLLKKTVAVLEKCQCSKDAAPLHKDIASFLEKKV